MPNRTDEIVSKGMEVEKALKATVKGLVGVFRTLMEQHGEVHGLLLRLQRDEGKRGELWPQIRRELLSHERGELLVLYPELRAHDETRAFAEEHDRDADALEKQIARLDADSTGTETWGELFEDLVDLVKDHVANEESTIFPAAQKALGKDRARELEPEFLEAKKSAMATE